jgi:hypothetical protein
MTNLAEDKEIYASSRIITIPSPELRQGVRLAVLSATSPVERAHIIQLLLREMTDQLTLSGGAGGEAQSVLQLTNAAAEHLDRMCGNATRSTGPSNEPSPKTTDTRQSLVNGTPHIDRRRR